ncbi:MAG TPA: preprotein translocase subunit SecG [Opitutaceae bacterium]|nr:preprotein translocase subunit SecG [Opitutaceae bacterium]
MSILIGIATFILILISLFLVLVVLAQKAQSDGGMGAAMGGGMAEAAFGAETGSVLSTATIYASIAFFVLSFLIYLGHVYQHKHAGPGGNALPNIPMSTAPANPSSTLPAPATAAPATATPANSAPATTTSNTPANTTQQPAATK